MGMILIMAIDWVKQAQLMSCHYIKNTVVLSLGVLGRSFHSF
jgi:hypothetical protein